MLKAMQVLTAAGAAARFGRAEPGRRGAIRGSTDGSLGADPVRRLRGRPGIGPGPEIHGRAATPAPRPARPVEHRTR